MRKIRKDDEVVILTGRDKGKRGKVLHVFPDARVLVQGVNMVKRHTRPNPNRGVTGGILDKEAPIHASNIALYNGTSGKGERIGMKRLQDGAKVRYFKKSGEVADAK